MSRAISLFGPAKEKIQEFFPGKGKKIGIFFPPEEKLREFFFWRLFVSFFAPFSSLFCPDDAQFQSRTAGPFGEVASAAWVCVRVWLCYFGDGAAALFVIASIGGKRQRTDDSPDQSRAQSS